MNINLKDIIATRSKQ